MVKDVYANWWRRTLTRGGKPKLANAHGEPIKDDRHLERVRKLRIPPAWTDVRIAPGPKHRVQAVGFDAKGRRQYIYHADWVQSRAEAKYAKLSDFVAALPHFREVTSVHLGGEGVTRERVLALITRLMMTGCFRIGGERYAKENKSYGIATLCNRHLTLGERCMQFKYRGKKGVMQNRVIADAELVEVMREVSALPGRRLFQYRRADGHLVAVTGREVNAYIKEIMGPRFSAKDFRTWNGTLMAARILAAYGPKEGVTARKKLEVCTVRAVSRYLGNTPAIARASYISPRVFAVYDQGLTLKDFAPRGKRQVQLLEQGLTTEELELIKLLGGQLTITFLPETPARATA